MKKSITGIAAGFLNGLFGSGGGSLLVPALQKFFGFEAHKSHATALAVVLPVSVVSALVYVKSDALNWNMLMWIVAGGLPGGFLGAFLLKKIATRRLHYFFGAVLIFAAVRMILC